MSSLIRRLAPKRPTICCLNQKVNLTVTPDLFPPWILPHPQAQVIRVKVTINPLGCFCVRAISKHFLLEWIWRGKDMVSALIVLKPTSVWTRVVRNIVIPVYLKSLDSSWDLVQLWRSDWGKILSVWYVLVSGWTNRSSYWPSPGWPVRSSLS